MQIAAGQGDTGPQESAPFAYLLHLAAAGAGVTAAQWGVARARTQRGGGSRKLQGAGGERT